MFILKTKQRRQTDGEALVQCSLDGFHVLSLKFGGKWKKLAETSLHGFQLLECMGGGVKRMKKPKDNIPYVMHCNNRNTHWCVCVYYVIANMQNSLKICYIYVQNKEGGVKVWNILKLDVVFRLTLTKTGQLTWAAQYQWFCVEVILWWVSS